jgi:protein SCO1/2
MRSPRLLALYAAVLISAAAVAGSLDAVTRPTPSSATSSPAGLYKGSEPPAGITAADFTLRDYRGRLVSMRAQRGKVVLLSFVDSKCTDTCPIVTSVIAQAYRRLPPTLRSQVTPILITVSPKVDTSSNVRRFLVRLHAVALSYLLGTPREMRPVWKAYGILSALETGNADLHSSDVRVFDRHGVWVSTQHAGVDLTALNLVADARTALGKS